MEDSQININKMLWNAIMKWKVMLLFVIIASLAMPYLLYYKDTNSYNKAKNKTRAKYQSELDKILENEIGDYDYDLLTEDEQYVVEMAKNYKNQLEILKKYKETSPYFQINPYLAKCVTLTYVIDIDMNDVDTANIQDSVLFAQDRMYAIGTLYKRLVSSEEFADKIFSDLKTDEAMVGIRDLITCSFELNTLYIEVVLSDGMDAEQMVTDIESMIQEKNSVFSKVYKYNIDLLVKDISYKRKSNISDKVLEIDNSIATMQTNIAGLLKGMTPAQKYFVEDEHRTEQEIVDEFDLNSKVDEDVKELKKPIFRRRNMIIGFFAGIVCFILYACVAYICSKKILDEDEAVHASGNDLLGVLLDKDNKKIFILDRILKTLKSKNKGSYDERIKNLATMLKIKCDKLGIDKLCISEIGTIKESDTLTADITKALKEQKINVELTKNIYSCGESLKKGTEIGCMVTLVYLGVSPRTELLKEVGKAIEYDINVIGTVIVER